MNRILSHNLWHEIAKLAQTGESKRAAIAYVSTDDILQFAEGDLLIVDASNAAIKQGVTSATVLKAAFDRGAQLFSQPGLHAKVMIIGNTAIIGSANISQHSQNLIEAGWVTDQEDTLLDAYNFIQTVQAKAKQIDDSFINRIQQIKVIRTGPSIGVSNPPKITIPHNRRTWLLSLWDYENAERIEAKRIEREYEAEARATFEDENSSLDEYHFPNAHRFTRGARVGDQLICIYTNMPYSDYRWAGKRRPVDWVYRHVKINQIVKRKTDTWFLIETFVKSDKDWLSWKQFQQALKRASITAKTGQHSCRLLSENEARELNARWKR